MTPAVVVDIGNSRMKWGRVADGKIVEQIALPLDNPLEWKRTLELWPRSEHRWVIAGVVPKTMVRFRGWLVDHNLQSIAVNNRRFLRTVREFRTEVEEPERIGIDRLVTAYAAWRKTERPHTTAVINVGTAMTVDFIKRNGVHCGGAILPGPRLMAQSLHDYTAQLPIVELKKRTPQRAWGRNTEEAIELGIASAVLGAADQLVRDWAARNANPAIFITGGGAGVFRQFTFTADSTMTLDPLLTLEGLRLVAEFL